MDQFVKGGEQSQNGHGRAELSDFAKMLAETRNSANGAGTSEVPETKETALANLDEIRQVAARNTEADRLVNDILVKIGNYMNSPTEPGSRLIVVNNENIGPTSELVIGSLYKYLGAKRPSEEKRQANSLRQLGNFSETKFGLQLEELEDPDTKQVSIWLSKRD